jgi:arylsulfatase
MFLESALIQMTPEMAVTAEEQSKKLIDTVDVAAKKYHVYPLDDRGSARLLEPKPPAPGSGPAATRFTYYAGATRLAESAAPPIKNRSWIVTANIKSEGAKTNGVVMAMGGVSSGVSLYLKDGVPIFDYNYFGEHTVLKAPQALAPGDVTIELDFNYAGGGVEKGADLVLKANGQMVASRQDESVSLRPLRRGHVRDRRGQRSTRHSRL